MESMYRCCAGMDVHKETVEVCVRRVGPDGSVDRQTRRFDTKTAALMELGDWLVEEGVQCAAMESTGVYWKPIWNLLEDRLPLMLVNAQHVKKVPGRKTDASDCQWLAQLLQYGLLRASFVPARPQRELRDLVRLRTTFVRDSSRMISRIQKVLEDANIKLASVASDVVGVSGRNMLRAMIAGETDPAALAELARKRMRSKIPELRQALRGSINDHHRFMLEVELNRLEDLERAIAQIEQRVDNLLSAEEELIGRLDEVPGFGRRGAQAILAEIGTDMSRFASAAHLCSWAGVCPGNNESAGKRKSGRSPAGNRWLRALLVECAWSAARTKGSYFNAQYSRLARRRGKKRAALAVAHSLLTVVYHMITTGERYQDLGPDHFAKLDPDRLTRSLVKKLESLGHTVVLQPAA